MSTMPESRALPVLSSNLPVPAIIVFPVLGQTIDLQYVDGILEKQTAAGWEEVFIGDRLESTDSLRLSGDGYAELSAGNQLLTLHKPGVYGLSDLV